MWLPTFESYVDMYILFKYQKLPSKPQFVSNASGGRGFSVVPVSGPGKFLTRDSSDAPTVLIGLRLGSLSPSGLPTCLREPPGCGLNLWSDSYVRTCKCGEPFSSDECVSVPPPPPFLDLSLERASHPCTLPCRLLIVPLFRGSRFESFLSHHARFTRECNKEDTAEDCTLPGQGTD